MGFKAELPDLKHFPKGITPARRVNNQFAQQISTQLIKQGHKYGKDVNLVRKLVGQISRGILLPKAYAAVHPIYLDTITKAKNKRRKSGRIV